MRRTQATVALVVLASVLGAWLLLEQTRCEQRSEQAGGADPAVAQASLERAFERIVSAPDPFLAAASEGDHLRLASGRSLALARRAWDQGAYWPACAVIGVVRDCGGEAIPWLSKAREGDDPTRSAAATLAQWFIDGDPDRAIGALIALHARFADDADAEVHDVIRRMEAAGAPTVRCLGDQLDKQFPNSALTVIRALGDAAEKAVPAFVARIEHLARVESERPESEQNMALFGNEPLESVLMRVLPELGDAGVEACIRLLYSPLPLASDEAESAICGSRQRFRVSRILCEAANHSDSFIPTEVYRVLACLSGSAAEWDATLSFVSRGSAEARCAFLNALSPEDVAEQRVPRLVETILQWQFEDPSDESDKLDVLAQIAPRDPRTSAVVEEVLTHGSTDEKAEMLVRMAPRFAAFSEVARSSALTMTSSGEARLRAAAIEMLAQSGTAVDDAGALVLIKAALQDDTEEVVVAALRAMASRGRAAASLLPLALARGGDGSPRRQLALLWAIRNVGARRARIVAQARRAWTRAARDPRREGLLEGVVEFLEDYRTGGAYVADLASALMATEGLRPSMKAKLHALSERPR